MVTIRVITNDGRSIDWNYDSPQQAAPRWKHIAKTGRSPDNCDAAHRAYYFGPKNKPGMGPDKCWLA